MMTSFVVHASAAGVGRSVPRNRWPTASDAPTISPGGSAWLRRLRQAMVANGAPRKAARRVRRVSIALLTRVFHHREHGDFAAFSVLSVVKQHKCTARLTTTSSTLP